MRILIAEPSAKGAAALRLDLENAGFLTDLATNATEFEEFLRARAYDLYLVNVATDGGSGARLLSLVRRTGRKEPLILMSAIASVRERISGLEQGADDYVALPIHSDELLARMRALFRRPRHIETQRLRAGSLELDPISGEVWCDGVAVPLRRSERRLLTLLMRRSGRVVPKPMIETNLSGHGEDLSPNAVEQLVSRLRKALSELPARSTIRTVRGAGYVLMEV